MESEKPAWQDHYDHPVAWAQDFAPLSLPEMLRSAVEQDGSRPMLDFYGRKFSYAECYRNARRFAAGLIGLAGPYAFDPTTWKSTAAIFAPAAEAPDRGRPIAFVGARRPIPALLLHGRLDRTVMLQNTRDFTAALVAAGGEARAIEYAGIGHVGLVSALARPLRWRAEVLDDVDAFIGRATRSAGA